MNIVSIIEYITAFVVFFILPMCLWRGLTHGWKCLLKRHDWESRMYGYWVCKHCGKERDDIGMGIS